MMTKLFTLLLVLNFTFSAFAQTFDMKTDNFRQTDETTITWELWIQKASGDNFGLHTFQAQWDFSTNILNTGEITNGNFTVEAGADAVFMDHFASGDATVVGGGNRFNFVTTNLPSDGDVLTLITDDWKHIATFSAQLTKDAQSHNFADTDPEFAFAVNGTFIVYAAGETYSNDDEYELTIGELFPAEGTPINDRQLSGYWFSGDGNWDDASLWNNVTVENTNTLPGANANVIINGNVTIPAGTTISLLPDGDGNGGELTVLTGEEALYTLTGSHNQGAGGVVNFWSDFVGGVNLGNPVDLAAGTIITIQGVEFTFGKPFEGWTTNPPGLGIFGNASAPTTTYTMPASNVEVIATWTGKKSSISIVIPNIGASNNKRNTNCNLQTKSNLFSSLTIAPGAALTVDRLFNDHEDGAAAIVLQSPAGHGAAGSLIHNNAGQPATVERYIKQHDYATSAVGWHFLSSPVSGQAFAPEFIDPDDDNYASVDLYRWNETNDTWLNYKAGNFIDNEFVFGRGYLIAYGDPAEGPNKDGFGDRVHKFSGPLNAANGNIAMTYTEAAYYSGWNLLGNPFASALDWNHGSWDDEAIQGTPQVWNEKDADYEPTSTVPAMNGFMLQRVSGVAGASIDYTIPSAARVHSPINWYKEQQNNRIRLLARDLERNTGKAAIVIFRDDAEVGIDQKYDTYYMSAHGPRFYSVVGNSHSLSLNALPEYYNGLTIPFAFNRTFGTNSTQFSIELTDIQKSLIDDDYKIYLDDLKLGIEHNLNQKSLYEFTHHPGDNINRFQLRFVKLDDDDPVDIEDLEPHKLAAVWTYGQTLYIHTHNEQTQATLFDLNGRQLQHFDIRTQGEHQYQLNLPAGVYLVRMQNSKGVQSKRVIVR